MEYASLTYNCGLILHHLQDNPLIYGTTNLHLSHLTQIIWGQFMWLLKVPRLKELTLSACCVHAFLKYLQRTQKDGGNKNLQIF